MTDVKRNVRGCQFLGEFRKYSLLSSACASVLAIASPVVAQDEEEFRLEEIVVTGTRIRSAEVVGSAVQTIDSTTLAASGKTGVGDFLRDLPINFAGGVGMSDNTQSGQDAGSAGANLTGGQGVNLRGLGALSTLVLVNDRRVAASGQFGDFVDVSNIPASAIERIEILQDGASAIYGSDAVGGVVNFILKRRIDRPVTTFKVGTATQGGGEEFFGSQLFPVNWDGGNILLGFEYQTRNNVATTDRDPYSGGSDFSALGGVNWVQSNAHFSPVSNIYLGGAGSDAGSSRVGATVPIGANGSLTGADLVAVTDGIGNTYNVYEGSDILPEVERYSFFASLDQEFSSGFSIFADARYSHRESFYNTGYGTLLSAVVAPGNPYYITGIDSSLTDALGNIGFGYVFDDQPNTRTSTVDSFSATAGFRVDLFSDWQLQSAVSFSREDQSRVDTAPRAAPTASLNYMDCALGSANALCATVDATPFNPFSTEPLTAEQIEEYYGYVDLDFNSDVWQASAQVDGTLFSLPAGDVKIALGGEFRHEAIDGYLSENTLSLAGNEGAYTLTARDAISMFGEMIVPLHETLDITVAGRYESFDADYGSEYDDFNPKIGFNFRAAEGLKFRGSWGTSFHAPPMRYENDDPQPIAGGNAAFLLTASRFGPCDSSLVEFNGIVGTPGVAGQQCSFTLIVESGGAGAGVLKPEEAETWTLGFDYAPPSVPGLNFSAGYFNIKVTDRIQRVQSAQLNTVLAEYFATNGGGAFASALSVPTDAEAQAVIDSAKFLGVYGPAISATAADVQLIASATQINIAALKESGFDFSLTYDFNMGDDWDVGLFAYGTYLLEYKTQAAPELEFIEQLGKYSAYGSPVAFRSKQGVRASKGVFDGILTMNYVDSYKCAIGSCYVPDATTGSPVLNSEEVPIDSWITFDLNLSVDLEGLVESSVASGARLSLSINNIFDEDPPFVDAGTPSSTIAAAYDPNNHTIIGRTVGLTLTKEW